MVHKTSKAKWGQHSTCFYDIYNVIDQVMPGWYIYLKFTQTAVHHFCELHITNLTSELCAESRTNAFTNPIPGFKWNWSKRQLKIELLLLGYLFRRRIVHSREISRVGWNSREFLRKKNLTDYLILQRENQRWKW